METTGKFGGLVIGLIVVQLIDIAIHVGTGQVEPLRILSNLVIAGWVLAGRSRQLSLVAGLAAIGIYLVLNGWFLTVHGLTNPAQGDAPRVMLFVLVTVSTGLA